MDLPTYRQQQAHSFYEQIATSTNPVFQQWDNPQAPLPQIGGEPRGVSGFPFQGDNALQLMMAATELGYTGELDGSAEMNIWLHKAVMRELAANGGKVPADLTD